MKKFNPVEYNRLRWGRPTKNHPKPCPEAHMFCNIDYEWGDNQEELQCLSMPGLPNVKLPTPQDQGNPLTYEMMTEQSLDDWIAQSMNHSLASLLNPQRKFHLPPGLEEQLKARYRKKINPKHYQDEPYFKRQASKPIKKPVGMGGESRSRSITVEQVYDCSLLRPKVVMGTPIRLRQQVDDEPKQPPRRRRNAVLLATDIHYHRFLKEMAKTKEKGEETRPDDRVKSSQTQGKEVGKAMIYSYNIESMRRKSTSENVPNSIIEKEFKRMQEPAKDFITAHRTNFKKQEEIQEKTRAAINAHTTSAMQKIDTLVNRKQRKTSEGAFRVTNISKKASVGGKAKDPVGKVEERVVRLLNSMQVMSENIDAEMGQLSMHLAEVTLRHPSNKIQHKWVGKAEDKLKQGERLLAIDCYKQALILQPDFFIPIYNIAVLLEKEKMLSYAKEWFQLAKTFQTDAENVSYGLALVQVKQKNFQAGLAQIDQLIGSLQASKKSVEMGYYYLRALCHKRLQNFDSARQDYEIIIRSSKPSNYHSLSYFLLSVVFAKSRRYTPKFNCLAYMNWLQTLHLLFYEKPKKIKEDGMSTAQLVDQLAAQPFFKRFSKNLLNSLLQTAQYQIVKKDSILFTGHEQSVIVINGLVSIWSHQKSITSPDTVSVLGQGGVIGAGQADGNLCDKPNYWFLAKTQLEVLRVPRAEFKLFWQGQITFEWDYKYNFLRNVGLFKGLCEYSLFKVVESAQLVHYKKGDILFNDCSYRNRLVSKEGLGFALGGAVEADPRFLSKKNRLDDSFGRKKRIKYRIPALLKKNIFKFNELKFNRLRYPGLFILVDGQIQIEDDRGFRCRDIIFPRDYFGQNLIIQSEGYHNYGRMLVDSPTASFYLLSSEQLLWAFTSIDKQIMTANAKNRKPIETIHFLKNRFMECLQVKMNKLLSKKD